MPAPVRVVFLDRATIRAEFRPPGAPHDWVSFEETPPEAVVARLAGAQVAVVNKVRLDAGMLAQLPELRLIAIAATGVDNVDLEACRARGVAVANVRGYARTTVPEHVFMLLLALRRHLLAYRRDLQAGAWQRASTFCLLDHPIRDLHGATLGLIGYGAIAQGVEALAKAFGMRVLVAERRGAAPREGRAPFERVLAEADALSLHCPLTPETRRLIDAQALAAMKPSAVLINTARGGLIDEHALAEALRTGRIAGAGLDVLSEEPPRRPNPLLEADLPNLIVTPHVGWSSQQAMQAVADQVVDAIEAFLAGERFNRVV
jgi:glycerate dehydrogenase